MTKVIKKKKIYIFKINIEENEYIRRKKGSLLPETLKKKDWDLQIYSNLFSKLFGIPSIKKSFKTKNGVIKKYNSLNSKKKIIDFIKKNR